MPSSLAAFVIASSLLCVVFTYSYVAQAYRRKVQKDGAVAARDTLQYEWLPIMVPLLFGIVNVIANFGVRPPLGFGYTVRMMIAGMFVGLVLSSVGTFGLDLPTKLFGLPEAEKHKYLFIAPLLYAAIWGVVVNFLNRRLLF